VLDESLGGDAFRGPMGERLEANRRHWALTAPHANPAMLEMFRDRDREPARDLVPWAGEFARQVSHFRRSRLWRMTDSPELRSHLETFVRELIATQDPDGTWAHSSGQATLGVGPVGRGGAISPAFWGLPVMACRDAVNVELRWRHADASATCSGCTFLDGHQTGARCRLEEDETNPYLNGAVPPVPSGRREPRYLQLAEGGRAGLGDPSLRALRALQPWRGRPSGSARSPRWGALHAVQGIAELYSLSVTTVNRKRSKQIWWSMPEGDAPNNTGRLLLREAATRHRTIPSRRPADRRLDGALGRHASYEPAITLLPDELEWSTGTASLGRSSPSAAGGLTIPHEWANGRRRPRHVFRPGAGSPSSLPATVNVLAALAMLADWAG